MTSLEPTNGPLTFEELQLATRNRGMPLEALRYDVTPTGLHYLLIHWDIPLVDAAAWRLSFGGLVTRPMELSLGEIRALPRQTIPVTLECAGNGRARMSPRALSQPWLFEAVSTAEWTGTPLAPLLAEAGLMDDAVELVFTGADRGIQGEIEQDYQRSLTIADATQPEVLLAYEMNGEPLQPQHGFPLRLLVPGWYGMASVKWLTGIEAVREPFSGYQQTPAYHYEVEEGRLDDPVTRIRVHALMVPPGIPDFFTRSRVVDAGRMTLVGRAWSGQAQVEKVEVGVDGAWADALLDPPSGEFAWRSWSYEWEADLGDHELACRAKDAAGNRQPLEQPWNRQGVGNNLVQRVAVLVR
jgi:DMSO/TMAO reductase YedYZ molybdopterin-dependent catalytic subunit